MFHIHVVVVILAQHILGTRSTGSRQFHATGQTIRHEFCLLSLRGNGCRRSLLLVRQFFLEHGHVTNGFSAPRRQVHLKIG
jgi:hypothetical protein